jgi:hypothetical protein
LLKIWHPSYTANGVEQTVIFSLQHTLQPQIIGIDCDNDDDSEYDEGDDENEEEGHHYLIRDIKVVLEEVIRCIDRATGRGSTIADPRIHGYYTDTESVPGRALASSTLLHPLKPSTKQVQPMNGEPAAKRRRIEAALNRTDATYDNPKLAAAALDGLIKHDPVLQSVEAEMTAFSAPKSASGRALRRCFSLDDIQEKASQRRRTVESDLRGIALKRTYI